VIDRGKGTVCPPDFSAGISQTLKSLRGGDFVDEMSIDVDEGITFSRVDDMVIEDLVVQSSRLGGRCRHDEAKSILCLNQSGLVRAQSKGKGAALTFLCAIRYLKSDDSSEGICDGMDLGAENGSESEREE
jgi:hypothetical protein